MGRYPVESIQVLPLMGSAALARQLGISRQAAQQIIVRHRHRVCTAVHRALAKGVIVRPSVCSKCNKPDAKLHAHHDDYSKPLDVVWLCHICHLAEPKERFWVRVSKSEDGCWEWSGSLRGAKGREYGYLFVDRRRVATHRYSWLIHFGPIPHGLCVLHRCDNPKCVRPDHLFLGTPQENMADCVSKGRHTAQVPRAVRGVATFKLNEEKVRTIRQRYHDGETQAKIAIDFGIHQSTVSLVVLRKQWTHI